MSVEIELKYLLSKKPAGLLEGVRIVQGYLAAGDPEVRIRSRLATYFIAWKSGEGISREEVEVEVSAAVFNKLWPVTTRARIEKTRYTLVSRDGLIWEIDEYKGALFGLFVAEVELTDPNIVPVIPYRVADVLVREVTNEPAYKNKALAVHGWPK